ncbi:hypothetical protein M1506_00945 [Patescibacteria group bacterium]|nr:hypothetical protein [Patescibacteria group bacterium]
MFKRKNNDNKVQKQLIFVILPVLIIAASSVYYATASQKNQEASQNILEARQGLSQISEDIAGLNSKMSDEIRAIQESRKTSDTGKTLALIKTAKDTNSLSYDKAKSLSDGLQKFSQSIGNAAVPGDQKILSEAVSDEISLTNEFMDYTKLMGNFLDLLSSSIPNDTPAIENEIKASLASINEKVDSINTLNQTLNQKISDFNKSLGQ